MTVVSIFVPYRIFKPSHNKLVSSKNTENRQVATPGEWKWNARSRVTRGFERCCCTCYHSSLWLAFNASAHRCHISSLLQTRAVLSPGNRAKQCKFRYVNSVRNFMWKLCYRKDNRAMRPIRGCPEIFRDSLTTPTATIPKNFHGVLFRCTLWMFLQNLKSVALPVPQIIGGTQKIWAAPGYAHAPFSPKFLLDFYSDWPCKCTRQIWSP